MATIYSTGPNENSSAAADDGNITSGPGHTAASWAAARAASGVNLTVNDGIVGDSHAYCGASSGAAGRGLRFECVRSFYHFDTSNTSNCTALTLDLMGFQGGAYSSGNLIVLESDAFNHGSSNALVAADWNNIPGWNGGGSTNMTGATEYSTVFPTAQTSWTHSGQYNVITLNAAAVTRANNSDHFIIALVNYTYDYQANTPLASGTSLAASNALDVSLGGYHNDFTTSGRRPRLSLTIAAPSGYGNIVNTVLATNIGKVNSVATANISKINSVD